MKGVYGYGDEDFQEYAQPIVEPLAPTNFIENPVSVSSPVIDSPPIVADRPANAKPDYVVWIEPATDQFNPQATLETPAQPVAMPETPETVTTMQAVPYDFNYAQIEKNFELFQNPSIIPGFQDASNNSGGIYDAQPLQTFGDYTIVINQPTETPIENMPTIDAKSFDNPVPVVGTPTAGNQTAVPSVETPTVTAGADELIWGFPKNYVYAGGIVAGVLGVIFLTGSGSQ